MSGKCPSLMRKCANYKFNYSRVNPNENTSMVEVKAMFIQYAISKTQWKMN